MVARCSVRWDVAGGVSAQANAIGERAVELAHTDGRVWEDALTALRDAETGAVEDPKRDFALEQKLEAAAAAPLEIASSARMPPPSQPWPPSMVMRRTGRTRRRLPHSRRARRQPRRISSA